jgi:hypothetical protein
LQSGHSDEDDFSARVAAGVHPLDEMRPSPN